MSSMTRLAGGCPVPGLVAHTTLGYDRDTPLRARSDDAGELARRPRLLAKAYLALPGPAPELLPDLSQSRIRLVRGPFG
jgi:hypothetical protein